MNAALLICDHTDAAVRDQFGDYPEMFESLFPEFNWHHYDCVNGEFPEDLGRHQLYFTTGSHHSAYENLPWINQLKDVIRAIYRRGDYFVGVCFGHQLMAEALGGKVERSDKGWCVGVHTFDFRGTRTWMVPQRKRMNLLMMCQDQVVVLPRDCEVLASNEMCAYAMFQIKDHMLGIQAHPEFSKAYNLMLMEDRAFKIGESTVSAAIKSLDLPVDREVFRHWVLHFVMQ